MHQGGAAQGEAEQDQRHTLYQLTHLLGAIIRKMNRQLLKNGSLSCIKVESRWLI